MIDQCGIPCHINPLFALNRDVACQNVIQRLEDCRDRNRHDIWMDSTTCDCTGPPRASPDTSTILFTQKSVQAMLHTLPKISSVHTSVRPSFSNTPRQRHKSKIRTALGSIRCPSAPFPCFIRKAIARGRAISCRPSYPTLACGIYVPFAY